jgi:EAL domain-containing protein (putative c-di-GMP-specific phosphodiesterase class I)
VEFLRAYGVDFAQGYHIGRPAPVEDLWPVEQPVAVRASHP